MTDAEKAGQHRPKAALISLVRNEELDGILQSMRQLEYHWNHNYNYPWIFFSEKPFTDEFKVGSPPQEPRYKLMPLTRLRLRTSQLHTRSTNSSLANTGQRPPGSISKGT